MASPIATKSPSSGQTDEHGSPPWPTLGKVLLLLSLACATPARPEAPEVHKWERLSRTDVLHYDVSLRMREGHLVGHADIHVEPTHDLLLDVDHLEHLRIELDGETIALEEGHILSPVGSAPFERIHFEWEGQPTLGLTTQENVSFTAFHTYGWMPTSFAPHDRATYRIRLTVPSGQQVASVGDAVQRTEEVGDTTHEFRLSSPYPAYLFGFAFGALEEFTHSSESWNHRILHPGFTPDELAQLMAKAEAAIAFFADKTGIPYPENAFTQVWIDDGPMQELAGMATMRASQARAMFADRTEDWLLVHEISHQWWGNNVTCARWSEFWLNEGFATFMTAAFKEQIHGREAYDREVALAERRMARLQAEGRDRPLVLPEDASADEAGGPVVYSKGMLLLHALRTELGDTHFWDGVQRYTRNGWQSSVTTIDRPSQRDGRSLEPRA